MYIVRGQCIAGTTKFLLKMRKCVVLWIHLLTAIYSTPKCYILQKMLNEVISLFFLPSSDRPDPPGNLNLVSTAMGLTLVWDRPGNAPPLVSTNYTLSIFNVTESGSVMYLDSAMTTTSFSIHFLEESLLGMPCQRFQFLVTADNDAGVGSPAIYNETVPVCKFANTIHTYMAIVVQ